MTIYTKKDETCQITTVISVKLSNNKVKQYDYVNISIPAYMNAYAEQNSFNN